MTFRPGTAEDVPLILSFVRALAEYERLAHEVEATEADLRDTLFGPRPYAEVMFAVLDGKEVGFALFFHNYSTFLGRPGLYLEDLYVRDAFRGRGLGKALLRRLAQRCVDEGLPRLQWWVLNWNRPAIDFYASLGAEPMAEWTVFRLSGDALATLARR